MKIIDTLKPLFILVKILYIVVLKSILVFEMHELGIAQQIFDTVLDAVQREKVIRIYSININIGELMAVDAESLQFGFSILIEGTPLAGAALAIRTVPIKALCNDCGAESVIEHYNLLCSRCKSRNVTVIDGKDLTISSIEVDTNGSHNA
jgi:hydrogenase nickel incorporation protein HypA/HybF